jgi:hypothetical protein
MARQEQDREDLLREATALVERAELRIASSNDPILAGFRRDRSFAIYFGGDPVYQFNTAGELRRAFVAGLMYKAEVGRLISLRREKESDRTVLVRRELSGDEQTTLLTSARQALGELRTALERDDFTLVGQVPGESGVIERIQAWLARLPDSLSVATRPHAS